MILETTLASATFLDLVEHPGGHDGGDFPQEHKYGIAADGTAFYSTSRPNGPGDAFVDEPRSQFTEVKSLEGARQLLRERLAKARQDAQNLEDLVAAFDSATSLTVYFDDEPYNEDDDPEADEDLGDEDGDEEE